MSLRDDLSAKKKEIHIIGRELACIIDIFTQLRSSKPRAGPLETRSDMDLLGAEIDRVKTLVYSAQTCLYPTAACEGPMKMLAELAARLYATIHIQSRIYWVIQFLRHNAAWLTNHAAKVGAFLLATTIKEQTQNRGFLSSTFNEPVCLQLTPLSTCWTSKYLVIHPRPLSIQLRDFALFLTAQVKLWLYLPP